MADAASGTRQSQAATDVKAWLFNPFRYVAGGRSLVLGLTAILLAGLLGFLSKTHFDGVLDIHTGRPDVAGVFVLEGFVDWLSLAVILFVLGKLVSKGAFRAIDLFGTQAMARWPTVVVAAAALAPPYQRFAVSIQQYFMRPGGGFHAPPMDAIVFGLVALVVILAVVWMVALMYQSYSVCCNIRGAKAIGTFIGGLLAAEVVSKLILWPILIR